MESKGSSVTHSPRRSSIDVSAAEIRGDSLNVLCISKKRRWSILGILILSVFVDVVCSSAFFVFTGEISRDLNILTQQQSWVVTAFSAPFAAFLLFWGRLSDIYSARPVYVYGAFAFASISLVLSFLNEMYSFLVLRALSGVAGSALVPSAYRLIASIFPEDERGRAYTLYGMTGSIANVSGVIIAGLIGAIESTGQARNWRWFFRLVSALSLIGAVLSVFLIPKSVAAPRLSDVSVPKWKRLDFIGTLTMLSSILLIIVGLTMGASFGWTSPSFLAPLIIGLVLFPFFFWWESRLAEDIALLPSSIWKIPNMITLIAFALVIIGWWAVNFIPFIELFAQVHHESLLVASVRTLPEGVAAGVISVILIVRPQYIARPQWPIAIAMMMAAIALVLWTQATSIVGTGYWAFVFPGMVIGSAGMQVALLATIVGVMIAAPPDKAGVVGATLQTSMHTSTVIALSIQAGLLTTQPGGLENYANIRTSWYFELGWVLVWLVGFVVLYKPARNPVKESAIETAV